MRPLARLLAAAVVGVVGAVMTIGLILWASGCAVVSVDKGDYVAHNEAIFRSVRQYPGAVLVNSYSIGIPKPGGLGDSGPPYKGFVTTHVYRVSPPARAQAIIRHFHRVLPGWEWAGPGAYLGRPPCQATFQKGAA